MFFVFFKYAKHGITNKITESFKNVDLGGVGFGAGLYAPPSTRAGRPESRPKRAESTTFLLSVISLVIKRLEYYI